MKVVIGVDLGSTTSKALILNEAGEIIGRGLTNSRSNYDVAVDVARTEAIIEARFNLLESRLKQLSEVQSSVGKVCGALRKEFRIKQYLYQLDCLTTDLLDFAGKMDEAGTHSPLYEAARVVLQEMQQQARPHFRFGAPRASFFRDLAASDFMRLAQEIAPKRGVPFDPLANLFDKAIILVENRGLDLSFEANISEPFEIVMQRFSDELGNHALKMQQILKDVVRDELEFVASVGTGYGRARLPFAKEQIRSEILCHGLGAHRMFPQTRTVLDIGGQDTKAIQVDAQGIVTSFQMNDRCAAGCGRYLGYIADEMNLGLHELGPLADESCRPTRISSTCTVFAGAELRDRLTMGEKREDILAGASSSDHLESDVFVGALRRCTRPVHLYRWCGQQQRSGTRLTPTYRRELRLGHSKYFARLHFHRSIGCSHICLPRCIWTGESSMSEVYAAGIDIGASNVKVAIAHVVGDEEEVITVTQDRIRRRDPRLVINSTYETALESAGLARADVPYVASTGEGELVEFRNAHFYGMTTHARGGLYLCPTARAVLDLGALHARAIKMDERAKVVSYRMTSQCASGSGQFLENIARYLGVSLEEVGSLSQDADKAEKISGICAVLAETDVINMVSRGISTPNILRGIHDSMAKRFVKLLRSSKATGKVVVTGGLAADKGLIAAMEDAAVSAKLDVQLVADERSAYAGAIGAALWGAFRFERLRSDPLRQVEQVAHV